MKLAPVHSNTTISSKPMPTRKFRRSGVETSIKRWNSPLGMEPALDMPLPESPGRPEWLMVMVGGGNELRSATADQIHKSTEFHVEATIALNVYCSGL
jgi:hypothetical protein